MPENPPIHAILNAVTDEKPKIFQSGRDIIYSLAAILAVMIASGPEAKRPPHMVLAWPASVAVADASGGLSVIGRPLARP